MTAPPTTDLSPLEADRPPLTIAGLLALSLFWFPINMFWTVVLTNFLPTRVESIVGAASKGTYLFYITIIGAVATTAIQLVISPFSDTCASKLGRRHPFVLWGTVGCAVCNVVFATTGNFVGLMLSFFGLQLCLNAATGPYQALIPDNVPTSRHGIASAWMGMANLLGQLAGAVFMLKPLGIPFVMYVITGLLLLGMAITVWRVPDRPATPAEQLPVAEALATLRDWQIKQNPDFYGLLYSRFFINLSYSTVTAFILYYLKDTIGPASKGNEHLGMVLLCVTVAACLGTLAVGGIADRVSKKVLIYSACAVLAFSTFVFCLTSSFTWVLILGAVFGAGWGAFSAVDWAMACNLLPKGGAAKYMAIWHLCMTVPQMIAPAFGIVADVLNKQHGHGFGWRAAMLSTVVYLITGALLLRRVREHSTAEVAALPR